MKHKWHDEIVAWAGGQKVEECKAGIWYETDYPDFNAKGHEFRIKPQDIFKCQKQACPALKEKKYLYVYNRDGKYELGGEPHPAMHYCPIIGKIEVVNDE